MGDGVVLESGTHSELLAIPDGLYARLVHAQELRDNTDESKDGGAPQLSLEKREVRDSDEDMEKVAADEVPLGRQTTGRSYASARLAEKQAQEMAERSKEKEYSLPYLFKRMAQINASSRNQYLLGLTAASSESSFSFQPSSHVADDIYLTVTGSVWPAFGIVYGKGISGFGDIDEHQRRHDGDRNALWLFIISLIAFASIGTQNFLFGASAAALTAKLKALSFRAILRQDSESFSIALSVIAQ